MTKISHLADEIWCVTFNDSKTKIVKFQSHRGDTEFLSIMLISCYSNEAPCFEILLVSYILRKNNGLFQVQLQIISFLLSYSGFTNVISDQKLFIAAVFWQGLHNSHFAALRELKAFTRTRGVMNYLTHTNFFLNQRQDYESNFIVILMANIQMTYIP